MDTSNWIFLTPTQAVDAFALDFQQYGVQPVLFSRLAEGGYGMTCECFLREERVRFRLTRDASPLDIAGEKMGFFLIHLLETLPLPLETLAAMAGLVFQAPVVSGMSDGSSGIWVGHGMAGFCCTRCGRCCRDLAYANDCTGEDVRRWRREGRTDILARVGETDAGGYEIWIDGETGGYYDTCPWLGSSQDSCECTIYETRPDTCRQYPLTPKHAFITGCPGQFT